MSERVTLTKGTVEVSVVPADVERFEELGFKAESKPAPKQRAKRKAGGE